MNETSKMLDSVSGSYGNRTRIVLSSNQNLYQTKRSNHLTKPTHEVQILFTYINLIDILFISVTEVLSDYKKVL